MKKLKVFTLAILAVLAIAVVVIVIIVMDIRRSGVPEYEGEAVITGLASEVKVIRDERGMPHIYAENEHDLYTAVGYVMAQERLWQMDLIRRATTGRLSEIFGEDYVQTDLFLRSLRMTEKSDKVISGCSREVLDCLTWFVEGVNAYIEEAGSSLPPEFRILGYKPETWTMQNTVNIIGYMGWDLAGGNLSGDIFLYRLAKEIGQEKAQLLTPYLDYTGTPVYPEFTLDESHYNAVAAISGFNRQLEDLGITPFYGSNNWAVSGERSETGKPIFSNDMHLGLSSPGIWIQMHHIIPGKLNVTGVFLYLASLSLLPGIMKILHGG
ncbi:MAG: penicillin acylase family protein [Bacteroidales bacterium]